MNILVIRGKGVIPYKETPKAPEDTAWNGPKEMSDCPMMELKTICTWVDSENADKKSAYKLPHHQAEGDHAVVWKGVSAAMGALLGARGGVKIPDSDKKGVYNHLKKHYADFGKEAPEFKEYSDAELKEMFPDEVEKKEFKTEDGIVKLGETKVWKTAIAKLKDIGNGIIEGIIATDDLDRHGEVLNIDGVNLKNYKNNPVVLWAHDYSAPPVAKAISIKKSAGQIIAKMEFAINEYPFAKTIYDLMRGKFLNTFSIGFIPEEMNGNIYTKSEMLEFSVVPVPANANALAKAKSMGIDTSVLEKKKSLDNGAKITENKSMDIKEILQKQVGDLTVNEIAELKANITKLSDEDKQKFVSVLEDPMAKLEKSLDAKLENLKKELDPAVKKNINDAGENDADTQAKVKGAGEMTKEKKFLLYVQAVKSKNFTEYLKVIGKAAMNPTDTSAVMPPAEFMAEVERLEEEVGIARKYARLKTSTIGNGFTYLEGGDDVAIFETASGQKAKSTKLSYIPKTVLWRRFTGLLPIEDELTEDSAVDLWNDATARFARAFAEREDNLVFNETVGTSPKNKGLLFVEGTNVVTLSGVTIAGITYSDLSKMIYGVPTPSANRGRFYMNKEILGVIQRIVDETGRPIWQRAVADGAPATILGKPYELVDVMPNLTDDAAGKAFIVFGDLDFVTLGQRTGLQMKMFDTGNVGDPDLEDQSAETLNLLTEGIEVLRCIKRFNQVVRVPKAFSVLKTGTAAS